MLLDHGYGKDVVSGRVSKYIKQYREHIDPVHNIHITFPRSVDGPTVKSVLLNQQGLNPQARINITTTVDPSIVEGYIINVDGAVTDKSWKSQASSYGNLMNFSPSL